LADKGGAEQWSGNTVLAQKVALKLSLHPDWRE